MIRISRYGIFGAVRHQCTDQFAQGIFGAKILEGAAVNGFQFFVDEQQMFALVGGKGSGVRVGVWFHEYVLVSVKREAPLSDGNEQNAEGFLPEIKKPPFDKKGGCFFQSLLSLE